MGEVIRFPIERALRAPLTADVYPGAPAGSSWHGGVTALAPPTRGGHMLTIDGEDGWARRRRARSVQLLSSTALSLERDGRAGFDEVLVVGLAIFEDPRFRALEAELPARLRGQLEDVATDLCIEPEPETAARAAELLRAAAGVLAQAGQ